MTQASNWPEAVDGKIRMSSIIKLQDYGTFRGKMKILFPRMTYEQIREVWNFGNDCWKAGFHDRE